MPRRVKVTVRPSADHPDFLTVQDAMSQISDAFALLQGEGDAAYDWKLVSASTNSPFTAVGEIIALHGPPDAILASAVLAADEAYQGLSDVLDGDDIEFAFDHGLLRRFLLRNMNGVGVTELTADDGPSIIITPDNAKAGLEAIKTPVERLVPKRVKGALEGYLVDAGQHRKQPALKLKERSRGRIIWCRIPEDLEAEFANRTSLTDVWKHARVRIRGMVEYSASGKITGMVAQTITHVRARELRDGELFDRSFAGELDSISYVDKLRDGELG